MFGTYRALLAGMVVLLHYANVSYIGNYAVFGFFILSGYLMTFIMQNNYGYTLQGVAGYALNRFLRIYPLYWFSCLVAILILLTLDPASTTGVSPLFSLPDTVTGWLRNFALLTGFNRPQVLIGPAWALTNELFFYICIGLGLSRNRPLTLIWFVLSVAWTLFMVISGKDFTQRYITIGAASLPFASGALIYHWRAELQIRLRMLTDEPYAPVLLFVLLLANHFLMNKLGFLLTLGFYSNYLICALIVISLMARKELTGISRRRDKWLGDLSYPLYLIHYPLAFLLLHLFKLAGFAFVGPDAMFFLLSLPVLILISWAMAYAIENRIELLRSAIKKRVESAPGD